MNNLVSVIIPTYNRKNDLDLCLDSVLMNDYENIEIIVVDNASTDGTAELLNAKYKNKITVIKSSKNLMAGGGRNMGASFAQGDYLLFIDSDNVIDKRMIGELVNSLEDLEQAAMVGPLMYYYKDKKKIWWAGADINLWTSKTNYIGNNKIDIGQYQKIEEVGHIPNIFMIKKDIWKMIGGIDEDYVMHFEESDLAERLREKKFKLYLVPTAKTWHNVSLPSEKGTRNFGGESSERAYYTGRNRVLFMKKNSFILQYLFFLFFFLPLFSLFYMSKYKNPVLKSRYIRGVRDGIFGA